MCWLSSRACNSFVALIALEVHILVDRITKDMYNCHSRKLRVARSATGRGDLAGRAI